MNPPFDDFDRVTRQGLVKRAADSASSSRNAAMARPTSRCRNGIDLAGDGAELFFQSQEICIGIDAAPAQGGGETVQDRRRRQRRGSRSRRSRTAAGQQPSCPPSDRSISRRGVEAGAGAGTAEDSRAPRTLVSTRCRVVISKRAFSRLGGNCGGLAEGAARATRQVRNGAAHRPPAPPGAPARQLLDPARQIVEPLVDRTVLFGVGIVGVRARTMASGLLWMSSELGDFNLRRPPNIMVAPRSRGRRQRLTRWNRHALKLGEQERGPTIWR